MYLFEVDSSTVLIICSFTASLISLDILTEEVSVRQTFLLNACFSLNICMTKLILGGVCKNLPKFASFNIFIRTDLL